MANTLSEKRGTGNGLLSSWLPMSLLEDFLDERCVPMMRRGFDAQLDLSENEHAFEVKVDLPGVSAEEVDIRIDKNTLTISGERVSQSESESENDFHRVERFSGKFTRTLVLPGSIEESEATAEFEAGVLKITIPKAEGSKPRRINIK